jgi:vacuolar-type H+-ATPase subunit C/Vma6
MLATPRYQKTIHKLSKDTLSKVDGCFNTTLVDRNDWLVTCSDQSRVYPLIAKAIEYLQNDIQ